jgi:hypothetical protein
MKKPWLYSSSEDRTRFFVPLALQYGVGVSAIVFYCAVCRVRKARPGVWTAGHLGKQIGVSEHQARRLLRQARQHNLLDFKRTTYGFRIWLTPEFENRRWLKVWRKGEAESGIVNFYRLSAARERGVTGATLFELLDPEPEDALIARDEGIDRTDAVITARRAQTLFPWMRKPTVYRALNRLVREGWLRADKSPRLGTRFRLIKSRWGEIMPDLKISSDEPLARVKGHDREIAALRAEKEAYHKQFLEGMAEYKRFRADARIRLVEILRRENELIKDYREEREQLEE